MGIAGGPHIELFGREVGVCRPVFVIAEAGVNHNGDLQLAQKLVDAAADAGADCVKFQTFKAERVVTASSPKADYQLQVTDGSQSQLAMLQGLELCHDGFRLLARYCDERGIPFLSTPYAIEDVDFLENLGVRAYKIASGQLVEHHFLDAVAATGKPVLLSTGMGTLEEVERAVQVIRAAGNDRIVVLQCHTDYPSRTVDANLQAMITMAEALDVPVGYSDHNQTFTAATVAVGLGACIVERHLTLDKEMAGPDHACSSDPEELCRYVATLREAQSALGSPVKAPTERERANMAGMRRSLVARRDLLPGTVLGWDNVTLKRPGTGITGDRAACVFGQRLARAVAADELITEEVLL